MDTAAPVGKSEMTILKDIDGLDQEQDQHMERLQNGPLAE
jgi:hypothetical protein